MKPGEPRARRRALWSAVDQGLSSSTSFLVTLGVARYGSETAVGAFAVSFTVYQLALSLVRALCTDPYVIARSASDPTDPSATADAGAAAGAALVLGAAVAVPVLAVAAVVRGPVGASLAVFALLLPAMLLQDMWRFVLVTHYRPRAAALTDFVWVAAMVPFAVVLEAGSSHPSATLFTGVWAGAAALAAVVGTAQVRHAPRPARARAYWRDHKRTWAALLPEFAITFAAGWLVMLLLVAVRGSVQLGHLRTVQTLFGPLSFAQLGAVLIVVPEGARLAARNRALLVRLCTGTAAGLAGVAAALAAVLLLMPSSAMVSFVGPIWHSIRPLVPAVAVMLGASGVTIGAIGGLRALGRTDLSLRARRRTVVLSMVAGVAGIALDGARGMALGLAAGEALTAVLSWIALRQAVSEAPPLPVPTVPAGAGQALELR